MFSGIRSLVGAVRVEEKNNSIRMDGFNATNFIKAVNKQWSTSKIMNNMLTKARGSSIEFPSFFAIEMEFILTELGKGNVSYYLPKRVINNMLTALRENTWIKGIEEPFQSRVDIGRLKNLNITLLEHQRRFIDIYDEKTSRYGLRGYVLGAAAGTGKCQPLYTKIKVPGGWITMGEAKVGMVVTCPDGTSAKILGVYPQGLKPVYEITFADGRKTRAGEEHLWKVRHPDWLRYDTDPTRTVDGCFIKTTKELFDKINRDRSEKTSRLSIPLIDDQFHDTPTKLPLDPYTLGLLLGDGSFYGEVFFFKKDEHVLKYLEDNAPPGVITSRSVDPRTNVTKIHFKRSGVVNKETNKPEPSMKEIIKELGLFDTRSHTKFIPEIYLNANQGQRLALIQGLMDTDGTVDKNSNVTYSTSSRKLAEQVQYLIRSIGGICKIYEKTPHYTYKGERKQGRINYVLNIRYQYPSRLFTLPRKKELCNDNNQYSKAGLRLGISSIEYVGLEETQCIMVDHPDHLYITDDFIVTHNTIGALALMETLSVDTVIVVSPNNAIDTVWRDTIGKIYNRKIDQWVSSDKQGPEANKTHYTMHYEYLTKFIEWAKTQRGFGRIGIILDESHNFNESSPRLSQRIEAFLELCKLPGVAEILWQSGTPIKAIGNEIIPLLRSIDPLFTPQAEAQFRPIFGREAKRAIDILAHRIGLITYKVESLVKEPTFYTYKAKLPNGNEFTLSYIAKAMAEFIKERMAFYEARLPDYERRYFELIDQVKYKIPERELKEYLALTKLLHTSYDPKIHKTEPQQANRFEERYIIPNLTGKDKADFKDARSVYKYYWLKVQGEALGRILGKERSRCSTELATTPEYYTLDTKGSKTNLTLEEMIDSSDSKTVIFSNYIQTAEAVAKYLTDKGYKPVLVHGNTGESVSDAVTRFERNDELNPIIATYKSLSTAVPLIMASTTICIDQPFRDGERKQAIARTARLGQKFPVRIKDLYLDTGNQLNISTRTKDIVEWSRQQVELLMGRTVADTVGMESYETPMPPVRALGASDEFPSDVVDAEVQSSLEGLRIPPNRSYAHRILDW